MILTYFARQAAWRRVFIAVLLCGTNSLGASGVTENATSWQSHTLRQEAGISQPTQAVSMYLGRSGQLAQSNGKALSTLS
ncbi:hypothetical protein [Paracoccus versutus]|uniref:hypothetical protein n=1 Tax=Paracoccus versutus TaxID=34007 RepID=UPI0011C0680C|nr:hypothetical protein [Paracoccus versutus]